MRKEFKTQIKTLCRLELCNLYGLNVLRFSRDKRVKRRTASLLMVWGILGILMAFYLGGLSYGLIFLGMEEIVPMYLIVVSSLLPFLLGLPTTGGVLFRKESYDSLCALPLTTGAIVISRFIRLYVENLLLTLAAILPGLAVYLCMVRPGAASYLAACSGIWFIPLLPMAGTILLGTLITGLASRMRHKSLAVSGLMILLVLGMMYVSSQMSVQMSSQMFFWEGEVAAEQLRELSSAISSALETCYPPAAWLGSAITTGNLGGWFSYVSCSLIVFGGIAVIVAVCFHRICQRLYGSLARHNYQMEALKKNSILMSLCKREFRRYFSSSVYVSNTIIGPVMACILSGALLFAKPESVIDSLPVSVSINLPAVIPFVVAGVFCIMMTTAVSVSMEGKNWWIVKSLPISFRTILDAKILMNLLLALPFYLISEILLIAALRPGLAELFWMLVIPADILLFSSVYGLAVNLRFPILDWENEVSVVKQSMSSLLGGMGGFLLAFLCAAAVGAAPEEAADWIKGGLCTGIFLVTWWLYRRKERYSELG